MLLHVLRHVEPDDRALVVEHELRERLRELGLPDAGRAEEDERADRTVRVLEAGAGAAERVRDGVDRRLLADDALVQPRLHLHELLHLALEEPVDGDLRPRRHDGRDVVLVDLLLHHRLRRPDGLAALGELLLERGQQAVADLGHALEVAVALGALGLHPQLVDLARDLLDPVEHVLLARPAGGELVAPRLRLGELALDRLADGRRLLRHRGQLDLELGHPPLGLVELDGGASRSPSAAATRPRRRGRSPCRGGSGR